ncbi:MAG: hypothetical protein KDD22_01055, partial [Bdellovibrionales bacterium]|nr:hypothetical protein [Bdellovibrionales bacterium]
APCVYQKDKSTIAGVKVPFSQIEGENLYDGELHSQGSQKILLKNFDGFLPNTWALSEVHFFHTETSEEIMVDQYEINSINGGALVFTVNSP